MNRVKENKEFLDGIRDSLNDVIGHYNGGMTDNMICSVLQNLLLVDISKSLAIIADRCTRTESAENEQTD